MPGVVEQHVARWDLGGRVDHREMTRDVTHHHLPAEYEVAYHHQTEGKRTAESNE